MKSSICVQVSLYIEIERDIERKFVKILVLTVQEMFLDSYFRQMARYRVVRLRRPGVLNVIFEIIVLYCIVFILYSR